jgi:hypothetical protein
MCSRGATQVRRGWSLAALEGGSILNGGAAGLSAWKVPGSGIRTGRANTGLDLEIPEKPGVRHFYSAHE